MRRAAAARCGALGLLAGALVGAAAGARASATANLRSAAAEAVTEHAQVRRWEHVVLVRTARAVPRAATRAVDAALEAGGAILDEVVVDRGPQHSDTRLLVRTRDPDTIHAVLAGIRRQQGVLGATSVQLPETPTWPGGPSFLTAWTGETQGPLNAGRVIKRTDRPEVLDKRDLLESASVPIAPTQVEPGTLGGFSMNLSQMFHDARVAAWLRRERRLKEGYLPILPEEDAAAAPPSGGLNGP